MRKLSLISLSLAGCIIRAGPAPYSAQSVLRRGVGKNWKRNIIADDSCAFTSQVLVDELPTLIVCVCVLR